MSQKVTSFTWNEADPAAATYDITLGFQPKFVILWSNARVGTVDGVGRANAAQLNDKDLPEVTWAFLDDLYKQRFEALEKIDVAQ